MSGLRRDERGMTLIEMLSAMLVGFVVLAAVLGLLDTTIRSSATSTGRMQAVREGRTTIDKVGQELRLASCPDTGPAIISASDTSVSFYVARPLANYTQTPVVERHTITYDATAKQLNLTVSAGTGTPPTWSPTPSRQTVLGSNLVPLSGTPIFRYLQYTDPTKPDTTLMTTPVAVTDLSDVAQVEVAFNALPSFGNQSLAGSRFDSTVLLRTDDPSDTDNTPEC
jgi:Tfp pilus assembly protein PilW